MRPQGRVNFVRGETEQRTRTESTIATTHQQRCRMAFWAKILNPATCFLQGIPQKELRNRNNYQVNKIPKQADITVLKSKKVDFRSKIVRRDFLKAIILTKRKIHQENVSIVKTYVLNTVPISKNKQWT